MLRDPLDCRDANRIAEPEERLVQRHVNDVTVRHALKSCALARREQAHLVLATARLEQYLPSAAAPWRT